MVFFRLIIINILTYIVKLIQWTSVWGFTGIHLISQQVLMMSPGCHKVL